LIAITMTSSTGIKNRFFSNRSIATHAVKKVPHRERIA
jgi:hypothetical protein